MEIRKKLNLTGGYSETLGSVNLKKYNTNNSNHSQRNKKNGKFKEEMFVKPSPGAFLKNTKRNEKQIMIEDKFQSQKRKKEGSLNSEIKNSKLKSKKEKLKKHLFNQNPKRIKNKKMTSLKGIFSNMGNKYTSSRDVNQKNYNFEKFQSYRGFPMGEDKGHKFSEKHHNPGVIEFERGCLDSREAMEKFADYIAEGTRDNLKNSRDIRKKMHIFSAQMSPKIRKAKFNVSNKDSATFDVQFNKKLFDSKPKKTKNNRTGEIRKQKTFNLLEDEDNKNFGGSLKHETNEMAKSRKTSMNIYDNYRQGDIKSESQMKVFDSNGRSYIVSRTVLTEEDHRVRQSKGTGEGSSNISLNNKHFKSEQLELYKKKQSGVKRFKMSGFLRDQNSESSKKEKESLLSEFTKEEKPKKLVWNKEKIESSKKFQKRGHRRSKTGVISRGFKIREENLKESLGNILLSDENMMEDKTKEKEKKEKNKQKQVVINTKNQNKMKKFEIFESDENNSKNEAEPRESEKKDNIRMTYTNTNTKNTQGKVFDLFAEDQGNGDLNKTGGSRESIQKRVNVSKKYDSGANFFIQPGKKTAEELGEIERQQKQDYEHKLDSLLTPETSNVPDYQNKKMSKGESVFSHGNSEKELYTEDLMLYQKPCHQEDSERNLIYQRFNASELKVKKKHEKQGWLESNINIEVDKIELGKKTSYSRRVVEDLKNFNIDYNKKREEIEEEKRRKEEQKKRMESMDLQRSRARAKADEEAKKKREKKNKKRRGHKRNVHSEQLTDYFRDIVQKNNYPIEVKATHNNMTPDISRNNSLNVSYDQEYMANDLDNSNNKNERVIQIEDSFEPTTESQSNPFQPDDTSKSKHIQISYENIRSSGQLTNVNQLITPKNHQLKSSFNFDHTQSGVKITNPDLDNLPVNVKKNHISKTIDKKMTKVGQMKSKEVGSFENIGDTGDSRHKKRSKKEDSKQTVSQSGCSGSDESSNIVELKRRKKLKKIQQKLINSKSVFLEDNDQNKYGSNQVQKRMIDFHNPDDESDIQFIKNKVTENVELDTFQQRNQLQIKNFNEHASQMTPKKSLNSDMRIMSRTSRKKESTGQSQKRERDLKVPMQTQEMMVHTKRDNNTSKGSLNRQSKGSSIHMIPGSNTRVNKDIRNNSNAGSFGHHPSFGQGSRNSKISITITHKSSKNSEINNNIIISHSLQNSGIHSQKLDNQNIFKIESPDINSGSQSPNVNILLQEEQVYPIQENLDDLRTMNKKNMTFNPNAPANTNIDIDKELTPKNKDNCLDLAIPKMRSSFEDSIESFHSEEEGKTPSEHPVTENTFGYGMEAVIKQASPKNVFGDSLSSFGVRKNPRHPPVTKLIPSSAFNGDMSDKKPISQGSQNMSKKQKKISINDHTEFYYEREGGGDSSFKFSNSDNSSRLKNITPTSNSRDYLRSSNNESIEVGSRRRSKFMRDVLRGKLNSPVRRIQEEISEEKEVFTSNKKSIKEPLRNDNQVKLEKEKKIEKMRNSELVAVKKKHSRRKRTQLYDNKSAMMMLERSKKISQQNSPVRKSKVKKLGQMDSQQSKNQSITSSKPKKGSISKLYKKQSKKSVMVMKSRRKNNSRSKHIDFVNISQERSTVGERSKDCSSKNSRVRKRRDMTISKEGSKNNSTSRNTRKKRSTVDKKANVKKFNTKNKKNKKRERLRKDTMDTKGSKSNSRVKKRESKQRDSRNVSYKKKNRDSKKTTNMTDSTVKGGKREKTSKTRTQKTKPKELDKKRKHGSILEPRQMKRVLEMKIMKYSTLGKVIDTSLEFYDLKRMLGEGSYAKVHLGVSILCGRKVAIKLYEKAKIKTRSSSERIFTEIGILRRMNHRNIVNFIEIFQNPKYIFIVLEYANGGDLLNYLKTKGRFKEQEYRKILQQIIDALEYIHEHKILHRDIKLDNILLTKTGHVKICDFGISRKMHRNDPVFEHIGTPAYIAPEIIKEKGYTGFGADIWSLGVMTYMALTGNVPFKGNTIEELHQSILTKEVTFSEKANLSSEMKRAIKGMLVKDPRRRMSLKDICKILDLRPTLNQKKEKDYANEEVVAEIKGYGYPEKMIKESLVNDMINHITALYKLLKN